MTLLLVALGAAVGAPLRFWLSGAYDDLVPAGTLAANTAGSLLLGVFSGLAVGDHAYALLGVGFCGALTTYSSFAVQIHDRGPRVGTGYAVLTVVVALAAVTLGFAAGAGLA